MQTTSEVKGNLRNKALHNAQNMVVKMCFTIVFLLSPSSATGHLGYFRVEFCKHAFPRFGN